MLCHRLTLGIFWRQPSEEKASEANFATIRRSIVEAYTLKITSMAYKKQNEQLIKASKRLPINDDDEQRKLGKLAHLEHLRLANSGQSPHPSQVPYGLR